MYRSNLSLVLALSTSLLCGCGAESKPPAEPPVPVAPALDAKPEIPATTTAPSGEAQRRAFKGIAFTIPARWREAPLSGMRQGILDAAYNVPDVGEELEVTFSAVGGGIESNMERWVGQFRVDDGTQPTREALTVDGAPATWIDIRGTFEGGMSSRTGAQSGWRLLGAGIAKPSGDYYIKLTGPEDQVAKVHNEFRELVKSAEID